MVNCRKPAVGTCTLLCKRAGFGKPIGRKQREIMSIRSKQRVRTWVVLSMLTTLLVLTGCAGSMAPPVENTPITTDYTIGPGDTLMIYVRDNPDLSMSIPVRPDGKMS